MTKINKAEGTNENEKAKGTEKVKGTKSVKKIEKEVFIKMKIDCENDEFLNNISLKGFEDKKSIQNTFELVGLLEVLKQQELRKLFSSVAKKK